MANYDSVDYTNGARVRVTENRPQWFSWSVTIPDGVALADEDEIRFAKLGAGYKVLKYTLGCDASLGSASGGPDVMDLALGSTVIDAAVEGDSLIVADRTYGSTIAVAHVSAGGDVLKLDTSTALDSQTSSGARTITLSALVGLQNLATYTGENVRYSSPYTL